VTRPSIGVVIPMHDAAATIGRTLDSVLAQSRPPDVVVVVDDHSQDASADIAAARGILVVASPGRGAAAARNQGVATAGTDFVAFLDADDRWPVDYLADVERCIGTSGADLLIAPRLDVDEQGQVFGYFAVPDTVPGSRDLVLSGNPITTSGTVVRTTALGRAGGFDEAIRHCEDLDLWIRLLDDGAVAVTMAQPTHYTVRDSVEPHAKVHDVEQNRARVLAKATARLDLSPAERRRARAFCAFDVGQRYAKSGHRLDAVRCFRSGASLPRAWLLLAFVALPLRLQRRARSIVRARRS
jgi:glycosyltransferase involved in cell wall biosynthesis